MLWHYVNYFNILGKPELKCAKSTHQTLKAGSSFICESSVTGSPQPSITWLYNGRSADSDNVKIADTYTTLSLQRVTLQQAGTYTVSAENSAGMDTLTFNIEVIGKQIMNFFLRHQ